MTHGELAYLAIVIVSMLAFVTTLAWVSRRPPSVHRTDVRRSQGSVIRSSPAQARDSHPSQVSPSG